MRKGRTDRTPVTPIWLWDNNRFPGIVTGYNISDDTVADNCHKIMTTNIEIKHKEKLFIKFLKKELPIDPNRVRKEDWYIFDNYEIGGIRLLEIVKNIKEEKEEV